ncbi:DUF6125 family protein [Desulfatiferula olefinivorans]
MTQRQKARLVIDLFHRLVMHHALWFNEVRHQMGPDTAMDTLWAVSERSFEIQMKRFAKQFDVPMEGGVPAPLLHLDETVRDELMKNIAVNWLANDGVWFQAVESEHGMNDAKRCNDSCWARFSPLEASSIKRVLGLPEKPGLPGLKRALSYRLYAFINEQSIHDETKDSFVFQMNHCRVQAARKRKNLDDYPCKSAGLVEYAYFAKTIDPRIETECIGCPPDSRPDDWFCAWRFSIKQ